MASKQLILLRHAKSDWYSGVPSDHERPLNKRGRRDAARVGSWLGDSAYLPQQIICSSAQRTRETLDLVTGSANWDDIDVEYNDRLYHASESTILDIVSDAFQYCDSLMVVAHNPGVDYVLSGLCPEARPDENYKLMTTATFAVIEFTHSDLSGPRLVEFIRPREITN